MTPRKQQAFQPKARATPSRPRGRANGEGSIYPYRNGYAAYAWVITPSGDQARKYVYGKTREVVHERWLKLQAKAAAAAVPTTVPTVGQYLTRWLSEVVEPNLEATTHAYYETMVRLYICPTLGGRRLDRLTTRDVQAWVNKLGTICQCCAQGKDAARPESKQRCCAIGQCCHEYAGRRTVQAARNTLRAALNNAKDSDELVTRNAANYIKVPTPARRRRRDSVWSVEEASRFLASAHDDNDPLYAAYVLVLVNALRKGEVLGLTWDSIDFDESELDIHWQLQRIRQQLIHKERVKTEDSSADDTVPMPGFCAAALKLRRNQQDAARAEAGKRWQPSDLVFTTRWGTPIEPRNFNRSFEARCRKADVPRIRVHDTRHTCASILAELEVHPRVAMRILRHAKITITMEVYTNVSDKITRAALNRLSDSLGGAPSSPADVPQHPHSDGEEKS